jgi:glycosyltransferase 2 family protein
MKKYLVHIFIYVSIVFLTLALIKADYLSVPEIKNAKTLILSIILLFSGFLVNGLSWGKLLKNNYKQIKTSDAISSVGLSIFGKYIPGKLWVILGRSEIISKKYNLPRKDIASLSLIAQFITIWFGLILGAFGLILTNNFNSYSLIIIIFLSLLTLMIFTNLFQKSYNYISKKLLKREFVLPHFSLNKIINVLPLNLLNWLFWCVGFYFMAASLVDYNLTFNTAWLFALSASLGIIAVIAPGGLGIREGIIVAFLTMLKLPIEDATTIAVTSRLWFLIGEIFIFVVSLILNKK